MYSWHKHMDEKLLLGAGNTHCWDISWEKISIQRNCLKLECGNICWILVFGQKGWNCRRISTPVSQMLPAADERILWLFLEIKWGGDDRGASLFFSLIFSLQAFLVSTYFCGPQVLWFQMFMVIIKKKDSADFSKSVEDEMAFENEPKLLERKKAGTIFSALPCPLSHGNSLTMKGGF